MLLSPLGVGGGVREDIWWDATTCPLWTLSLSSHSHRLIEPHRALLSSLADIPARPRYFASSLLVWDGSEGRPPKHTARGWRERQRTSARRTRWFAHVRRPLGNFLGSRLLVIFVEFHGVPQHNTPTHRYDTFHLPRIVPPQPSRVTSPRALGFPPGEELALLLPDCLPALQIASTVCPETRWTYAPTRTL